MEKLMDVMIEKCSIECNDILRSFISQHNALAGLYIIRKEPLKAVEHYNSVLGLIEKYKDKKIKVDPCQVKNKMLLYFTCFNKFYYS